MTRRSEPNYTTGFVTSRDGTAIGYRQMGRGPALILVHGGMMASQNLMKLADHLACDFAVYLPDRRGRGLSGPFGERFGIDRAVEDLSALVDDVGCARVFGLSVGAIVALYTALAVPAVRKVAVYEPPFALASVAHSSPTAWLPRYEREVEQGRLADALVTVAKGVGGAPIFGALPRWFSVPFMRLALAAEARQVRDGDTALRDLIPTMRGDSKIVVETADSLEQLGPISADLLLLGGSRSPAYLGRILDAVERALPRATRLELHGLRHTSADNGEKPARVAKELSRFFCGG